VSDDVEIRDGASGYVASKPFQILCLSGGGFRGLYTAALLEKLRERAEKPLSQVFNLIAGTSIGGILALGLAAGIEPATLRAAFEENADLIFPRFLKIKGVRVFPRVPLGIFGARYPQDGLRETIEKIFGERSREKLCDVLVTDALVCSVDLNQRGPRIFRSKDKASDVTLLDAALATSATPTFFPEHKIDLELHVDGGLIANAPDMIALLEALKTQPLDEIRMVSLGTAGREGARPFREAKSSGLLGTAKETFFLTLDAQEALSVAATKDLLRKDRYLRIDVDPSEKQRKEIGLDSTGKVAANTLKIMAGESWNTHKNDPFLNDVLNRSR
jgi:patatin-like phospholipase/acyl hydrolase